MPHTADTIPTQPPVAAIPRARHRLDQPPHRFLVLDGFRGLAAGGIVLYHVATALGLHALAGRAYLAVDFFFVLSGFVLAHAYEERLRTGTITPTRFLSIRFARLWPMAAAGSLLGCAATIARFEGMPFRAASAFEIVVAAAFASLLLPDLMPGTPAFPLNPPHWSIFLEVAANYVYAFIAPLLSTRLLASGVAVSAVWLASDTLTFGNANHIASARVAYGFFVGVLIYRSWLRGMRPTFLRAAPLAVVLTAALFSPSILGSAGTDTISQLIVFPTIVWVGASASPGKVAALCRVGGTISYPLYVVHYPVLMAVLAAISR